MGSDIPDIDNCCDKETYAFFGLAAYWAQVLEHAALNLALVLKLPQINLVNQELFEKLYESLTKKTFGQLLNLCRDVIKISESDEELINEALKLRNILVHDYFREHAEDFVSEVGRQEMKKELQSTISKFRRADSILENLYLPLWTKYGVTDEIVENELKQLHINAELRDKAGSAI